MARRWGVGHYTIVLLTVGLLGYGGASFWSEMGRAAGSFSSFQWPLLVPVLGLSLLNNLLRAVRWEYYLRLLAVRLPLLKSGAIFFASLLFSITPGRVGEVCKSYFVNNINGTPVAQTVPVVVAERLQDLLATALLAAAGAFAFSLSPATVALALAGALGLVLLLGSRTAVRAAGERLGRLPGLRRVMPHALELYEGTYILMRPAPFAVGLALSVPAWFTDCLGTYLILTGFGVHVPLLAVTFAYTLATLIGSVSMMPGGLGATEGSLAALLTGMGAPAPVAIAATFLIRACTFWFSAGVGGLLLLLRSREFCGGLRLASVTQEPPA